MFDASDYELVWPHQALFRELTALLAERPTTAWASAAEDLLEEAFASTIPVEGFRSVTVRDTSTAWAETPTGPQVQHLRELLAAARAWPPAGTPQRPFWSQRQGRAQPRPTGAPSYYRFASAFLSAVRDLDSRGYFDHRIPAGCDDHPEWPVVDGQDLLRRTLGMDGLWPVYTTEQFLDSGENPNPDLMFDLVEALHDLVARPRRRDWHSFMRHHHYSAFSTETARLVYRAQINGLLDATEMPLRLADSGEDVGRLVLVVNDGRDELLTRALVSPEPTIAQRVAHAVALFRGRHANVHDKRSAIVALALVLEERRTLLKTELLPKDEGALFQLANNFALRHERAGQQRDYDPVFLDWVFWWYLATVELTDRLIARQVEP
ncbi:MAG: hypothetical protein ACT4P1_10660 [Sporichthyaceae bacterium]